MNYQERARLDTESIREWFKDHEAHEATYRSDEPVMGRVDRIVWRNPRSSNYFMSFMFFGNQMVVTGDGADAIFSLTETAEPATVAGYSLDYLLGKLAASDHGRDPKDFDSDVAKSRIDEYVATEAEGAVEEAEVLRRSICNAIDEGRYSFEEWMHEEGDTLFGDDWYEYLDIGDVLPIHIRAIQIGLRMAVEQLGLVRSEKAMAQA